MTRPLLFAWALAAILFSGTGCREVSARVTPPTVIDSGGGSAACVDNLNQKRHEAQRALLLGDLIAIACVCVGALSAVLAAVLDNKRAKIAGALCTATVAVLSGIAPTVGDASKILERRSVSEHAWWEAQDAAQVLRDLIADGELGGTGCAQQVGAPASDECWNEEKAQKAYRMQLADAVVTNLRACARDGYVASSPPVHASHARPLTRSEVDRFFATLPGPAGGDQPALLGQLPASERDTLVELSFAPAEQKKARLPELEGKIPEKLRPLAREFATRRPREAYASLRGRIESADSREAQTDAMLAANNRLAERVRQRVQAEIAAAAAADARAPAVPND